MKVSKVYEVWVGGDMVDDDMTLNNALKVARKEFIKEQKETRENRADVIIDEHTYIEIEELEDLDTIDNDPKW